MLPSLPLRLLAVLLLPLPPLRPAAAAAAAPPTTSRAPPLLTLALPPSALLPNPQALPARTYATLTAANLSHTALLARDGTFAFRDVPAGHSYVAEVWTLEYAFAPLRVDVTRIGGDGGEKKVEVWQTFRGHEWGNKGEKLGDGNGGVRVKVQVLGERRFYEERKGFSPMTLLQNPMILMGLVAMVVLVGMPKLLENMDPEIKEEFEKRQKQGPFGGGGSAANPMGNFDMASWMAGADASKPAAESKPPTTGGGGGGGGGGRQRRRG